MEKKQEHVIKVPIKFKQNINPEILQDWIDRYNKITHDIYSFLYIVVHYCAVNGKEIPQLDHNTLSKIINYTSNEKLAITRKKRKTEDDAEEEPKKRSGPKPKIRDSEAEETKAQFKRELEQKNRKAAEDIFNEIIKAGLWKTPKQLQSREFLRIALNNYAIKELETVYQTNIFMHFESRYLTYLDTFVKDKLINPKINYKSARLRLFKAIIGEHEGKSRIEEYISEFSIDSEQFITDRLAEFPLIDHKHCVAYQLKASPQSFLPLMIKMNLSVEKCFSVMPQCQSFIPRSMTINTETLRCLLNQSNPDETKTFTSMPPEKLWSLVLDYKKYETNVSKFKFLIQTDGCSMNLHMLSSAEEVKKDPIPANKCIGQYGLEEFRDKISKSKKDEDCVFNGSRFVGIDPGHHKLVQCWAPRQKLNKYKRKRWKRYKKRLAGRFEVEEREFDKSQENIYRYTAKQRKHEMKTKVFQRKREVMLKSAPRIQEIQLKLSSFNTKTSDLSKYCEYLEYLWSIEEEFYAYYSNIAFRQFKLESFRLKKKSEAKFIQSMKRNYGSDAILLMGDWSETGRRAMGGLSPMPNIGFRKLLARNFLVLNTSEYKTSKTCRHCMKDLLKPFRYQCGHEDCKKSRIVKFKEKVNEHRRSTRHKQVSKDHSFTSRHMRCHELYKSSTEVEKKSTEIVLEEVLIHEHKNYPIRSLLKCPYNTEQGSCGRLVNRDLNSAELIYRQGMNYLENGEYLLKRS